MSSSGDKRRLEKQVKAVAEKAAKKVEGAMNKSLGKSEKSSDATAAARLRRDTKKAGGNVSARDARDIIRETRKDEGK